MTQIQTESLFGSIFIEFDFVCKNEKEEIYELLVTILPHHSYRNNIDFLVCEFFPEWRKKCLLFYKGKGQQLKDEILAEERRGIESTLLLLLDLVEVIRIYEMKKVPWRVVKASLPRINFTNAY